MMSSLHTHKQPGIAQKTMGDVKHVLLSLNNEEIGYANHIALRHISLSIELGERVAIIGKSGSGKTTLLRKLYSLKPDSCAFIHQNHGLVPQLNCFHNMYMGRLDKYPLWFNLRNLIKPSAKALKEIRPIAEGLGLADELFCRVGELSGGQQQRVGIGRALYSGNEILLADEPVSSLDIHQQKEIMELLVPMGRTVISTLHSVDLAKSYFRRIIGLKNKTILFDLPAHLVTQEMLSELYNSREQLPHLN